MGENPLFQITTPNYTRRIFLLFFGIMLLFSQKIKIKKIILTGDMNLFAIAELSFITHTSNGLVEYWRLGSSLGTTLRNATNST